MKGKGTSCALTRAIQRHDALAQRLGAIKDGLVLAAVENRTLIEARHDEIAAAMAGAERYLRVDLICAADAPIGRSIFGWRRVNLNSRRSQRSLLVLAVRTVLFVTILRIASHFSTILGAGSGRAISAVRAPIE